MAGDKRNLKASSQSSRAPTRNIERANKVIRFIENLVVPSGKGQGKPFLLDEFQKRFIRNVYGPREPGRRELRRVRRAILSIARKNGKTALIAALVLVHLVGPEARRNGEMVSAANDREQASIVFKVARQIVEITPGLSRYVTVVPSTKTLVGRRLGTVYRAISAEAGTKHGLNPSLVVYDELAQAKKRDLYDVLDSSFGAQDEPLFAIISTQSNDPEHIMSKLIDDGLSGDDPSIYVQLHAVPDDTPDEDIWDEKVWKLANPALGTFRSLEDIRSMARKAKRMPSEEPKFRNLYLNQRVSPLASLLSRVEWMACKRPETTIPEGSKVYLSLDLSGVVDLSCLCLTSAEDEESIVDAIFWKPEDLLKEHSKRDFGSGSRRYIEWRDAGFLRTSPGRSIDPEVVAKAIADCFNRYKVLGLAYDRWRINDIRRELDKIGLETYEDTEPQKDRRRLQHSGLRLVPWGQGFRDMAPAIDALEVAVIERKIAHGNNPVLNWNIANAVASMDPAGNRKLDKEKARFRIDGAVSLTMGIGLKSRDRREREVDR